MKNSGFHSYFIQIPAFAGMTPLCHSCGSRNLSDENLFQPARFIFETGPGRSAEIHTTVEEQEPGVPAQMRDAPQTTPQTPPATPAAVAESTPQTTPAEVAAAHEAATAAVSEGAHAGADALKEKIGGPKNAAIGKIMETFIARVKQEGHDFAHEHDTNSELDQNPVFQKVYAELKSHFENHNNLPDGTPENLALPWLTASAEFMVAEIDKFSGMHVGEMEASDVTAALEKLSATIGPFETWLQKQPDEKLKKEYADFKAAEQQTAETAQKSLAEVKTELTQKATELETKLAALPSELIPTALREGITTAKQNIEAMTEAGKKTELETTLAAYTAQTATLEGLKEAAMHRGVIKEKKTERDKILEELRAGTKTPEDAKIALDSLKQAADEARKQKHEADGSVLGGLSSWLKGIGLSINLDSISKMFVGWAAKGGFLWSIANSVVGKRSLAANGDKKAQAMIALEDKMYNLGIDDEITQKMEGEKTADVVRTIRENPAKYTTDTDQQQKLAVLADKLDQNNAAGSELALAEFAAANSGVFLEVEAGMAVASATPAPATTPAADTETAPATSGEAASVIPSSSPAPTATAAAPTTTSTEKPA